MICMRDEAKGFGRMSGDARAFHEFEEIHL